MRNPLRSSWRRRRGFTLLEVLIGLGILTAGILSIMAVYPYTLRAQRDAELLTLGAALAQMKAEQVRRDDKAMGGALVHSIQGLGDVRTKALVFSDEPRLSYSFASQSVLNPTAPNPAKDVYVIIYRAPTNRPNQDLLQDVIYELHFNK